MDLPPFTSRTDSFRSRPFLPPEEVLRGMPALYSTEDVPVEEKLVHAHFFIPSQQLPFDWFLMELSPAENYTAFGFVCLQGDTQNAELGYFALWELADIFLAPGHPAVIRNEELTTPTPWAQVRQEWGGEVRMNHTSVKKKQSNSTEQTIKENTVTTTATAAKPAESKQEQQKSQEKPQSGPLNAEDKQEQRQATATVTAPVASTASVRPQEVKEEVLNLSEVAALTGRSYAGVNASAEKLAAAGANTSGKGKEWKVTRSQLVKVGWLDAQGNRVAPQRGRGASKPRTADVNSGPFVLSIPELVLVAELAEQDASEKKQAAAEASAAARAARRAVEDAVKNAEAEFKQAEANLLVARSIMEKQL